MRSASIRLGPTGGMFDTSSALREFFDDFPPPYLIVDSIVGKGNVSVANALIEGIPQNAIYKSIHLEEHLPRRAVLEDLEHYKTISNNYPSLLNIVYRVPLVFLAKKIREKLFRLTDLCALRDTIAAFQPRTVIATSHRPSFWLSLLKQRFGMDFLLAGVLTECGFNYGWKYVFWDQINAYLAPMRQSLLGYPFPSRLRYYEMFPLCGKRYAELRSLPGDKDHVLLAAGFWGQIPLPKVEKVIDELLQAFPGIHVHVVCGLNSRLFSGCQARYGSNARITVHAELPALYEVMKRCGSVISKPGFSTMTETSAAGRKLFLLKGMPVAEDNNARFAIQHLNAAWYSIDAFCSWRASRQK